MNPWQLYDHLLASISGDIKVEKVLQGSEWTFARLENGFCGLNATQPEPTDINPGKYEGMAVSEAAGLIRSWNWREAAVGGAIINAVLNRVEHFGAQDNPDAFLRYRDRCQGKKVAVIGHFAYLEKRLKGLCDLYILERSVQPGDYHDSACEYLLPGMDVVFITGSALANKTLPRLLELSKNAFTVISGPSTPVSPALFDFGVDALCGFCVTREDLARQATETHAPIFSCGEMICLEKGAPVL